MLVDVCPYLVARPVGQRVNLYQSEPVVLIRPYSRVPSIGLIAADGSDPRFQFLHLG